jgi:hypothetical protein
LTTNKEVEIPRGGESAARTHHPFEDDMARSERAVISEELAGQSTPDELPARSKLRNGSIEDRVARLEEVVATLQNTEQLEERVKERVSAQLAPHKASAIPAPSILLEAGRQLLPAALQSPPRDPGPTVTGTSFLQHHPWLLVDALAEAQAIFRMYFDKRYRASWVARVAPVAGVILLICSWLILPVLLDKIFTLMLAFVVYKVLHREVQAYRLAIADLGAMPEYRTVSNSRPNPS